MKRKLLFLFWLAGILFPMGWLRSYWPEYRAGFDAIFGPEWMHIFSHLVLFAGLGALLVLVFPQVGKRPLLTGALILLVGVLQESFQALSAGNLLPNAVFDLGVDLAGGLVGLWAARVFTEQRRRSSARTARPGPSD